MLILSLKIVRLPGAGTRWPISSILEMSGSQTLFYKIQAVYPEFNSRNCSLGGHTQCIGRFIYVFIWFTELSISQQWLWIMYKDSNHRNNIRLWHLIKSNQKSHITNRADLIAWPAFLGNSQAFKDLWISRETQFHRAGTSQKFKKMTPFDDRTWSMPSLLDLVWWAETMGGQADPLPCGPL